jgi:hypothetical protein
MKAKLKSLHSPDIPDRSQDLADWVGPSEPDLFGLLVEVLIGAQGEEFEHLFSFIVCSPLWLSERLAVLGGDPPYIIGHHYIIMARWDYDVLHELLLQFCARSEGPDWRSVTRKLSRYGAWEFEGDPEFDK